MTYVVTFSFSCSAKAKVLASFDSLISAMSYLSSNQNDMAVAYDRTTMQVVDVVNNDLIVSRTCVRSTCDTDNKSITFTNRFDSLSQFGCGENINQPVIIPFV